MATRRKLRHRKLRKSGKSSRKHQRTFIRKNRVKRNSKRRRRVMRGGGGDKCDAYPSNKICCKSKRKNEYTNYCSNIECDTRC